MTILSWAYLLSCKLSSVKAKWVTHVKTSIPQPAIAVKTLGGKSREGFMA